jgi:hypothetical protein
MDIPIPSAKLATMALAAMVALAFLAADAMAAKEKFERTKPHVNVGTIGQVDQEPVGLANPVGSGATPPVPGPSGNDCKPDPSKPADAQGC